MNGARPVIRWGRVFGGLWMSLPFFAVLGGLVMNVCVNSTWAHDSLVRVDWQQVRLQIVLYPILIFVGAPFVLAVVGSPVAAGLATLLRRVRRRWLQLTVQAATATAIGTVVLAGYWSYGLSRDLPMGATAGASTVFGIVCADAISVARDKRRLARMARTVAIDG